MNNLDIVLRSVYNAKQSRILTSAFQAATSATSNWVHAAELFPNIKPMSSTSKTVLNSYD
jgi:hypothetical protein